MRFSTSAVIPALAAFATAQANNVPTADTSKPPSGNPISKPGLNEQVPKGQTYTISWNPTTSGTVSLILLRGPSNNVVPMSTIVSSIPNSGSYAWAVSDSLELDTTHYGIELIDDAGHTYQYSTQFGISGNGGNSGADAAASGSFGAPNSANSTSTATVIYASVSSSSATGTANASIPVLSPTVPMTVPSTLMSTATSEPSTTAAAGTTSAPASSQSTGAAAPFAAARNMGAFAIAGLVGAFVV